MECLNLGCGNRYIENWTNIDYSSTSKNVISCDLKRGIPFDENTFDFVYNSHVLEHFSKEEAPEFIFECWRVLKPGGIVRIVVPDLFLLVKKYIESYEKANNGESGWIDNYEWMVLHLLDQCVRDCPGGEMLKYISKKNLRNEDYVFDSWGVEGRKLRDVITGKCTQAYPPEINKKDSISTKYAKRLYELLLKSLLSREDYKSLNVGRFRVGGECHKWMYDDLSLSNLLRSCGFKGVVKRPAFESYFENWGILNLDTEQDGTVYRPDSLYMEGRK